MAFVGHCKFVTPLRFIDHARSGEPRFKVKCQSEHRDLTLRLAFWGFTLIFSLKTSISDKRRLIYSPNFDRDTWRYCQDHRLQRSRKHIEERLLVSRATHQ